MTALRRFLFTRDERIRALLARMHRDEGGNVIVLYVAASLLLVGMLWAIIGTGARVVQKETIQSSADAAAFSAAVIRAKGLNIIAFCNLVMALLLSILMLLRLIKGALTIVLGVCLAACFDIFGGEVLCALAGPVEGAQQFVSNLESTLKNPIMQAIRGLSTVEQSVQRTFPALAFAEALRVGTHDHYQKNMGGGILITAAWPILDGLPAEEGTWEKLCHEGAKSVQRVLAIYMGKVGLGVVGDLLGGAVSTLMEPLEGILCDSGGSSSSSNQVPIKTTKTYSAAKGDPCSKCDGADFADYIGDRVTAKDSDGNVTASVPGQRCVLNSPSTLMCTSRDTPVTCTDGQEYVHLSWTSCNKQEDAKADLGGQIEGDKPKPMELKKDFDNHPEYRNVRAFTLLTDAKMDDRRRSVGVATKNKGSRPFLNQLMGMAEAEIYAFNGHEDLWHMNWRARLVRFTFTDDVQNGGGDPSAGAIADQIKNFLLNDVGGALGDQFLLH
jgi:hypothetical protein